MANEKDKVKMIVNGNGNVDLDENYATGDKD